MTHPITESTEAVAYPLAPVRRTRRLKSVEAINRKLAPRGIELISDYRGGAYQATFRAPCGHEWRVTASSVINSNSGCPKCAHEKHAEQTRRIVRKLAEAKTCAA
ncbi:zinc-ribbon domain-containing protein [Citrobacter portucalensis]|uniref:zinc-ribbon domain-containing protein n=1 Tax=Citrobacter portucalensis TaxID=1639133 RepID=UPI00226BBD8F|nr:zinc-ribbon domain-containing protein [Citrobacter portucalensis]